LPAFRCYKLRFSTKQAYDDRHHKRVSHQHLCVLRVYLFVE